MGDYNNEILMSSKKLHSCNVFYKKIPLSPKIKEKGHLKGMVRFELLGYLGGNDLQLLPSKWELKINPSGATVKIVLHHNVVVVDGIIAMGIPGRGIKNPPVWLLCDRIYSITVPPVDNL